MSRPIYLDYAATTPVDKRVADVMLQYLTFDKDFGNPASNTHIYGWNAAAAIDIARGQVATMLSAKPCEIVFTSGATESDNLALKGIAQNHLGQGGHIITTKIEHKAILDTCHELEKQGFLITYLTPDENGIITPMQVEAALTPATFLVSIMHVNNEVGVIADIAAIGAICRKREVLFHVDAAQSIGKVLIDVTTMPIDLISISAHKIYGPKGIGALYVRSEIQTKLAAQMLGGGHERKMRSGTLATHQIAGFGKAMQIACDEMTADMSRIAALRKKFVTRIKDIEAIKINGSQTQCMPGIINISFAYIEGESLLMSLKELAVSTGSACSSASHSASHVLQALGIKENLAQSSVRFSLGRFTTEDDIKRAIKVIEKAVKRLRAMSPLWDMYKEGIDIDKINWSK